MWLFWLPQEFSEDIFSPVELAVSFVSSYQPLCFFQETNLIFYLSYVSSNQSWAQSHEWEYFILLRRCWKTISLVRTVLLFHCWLGVPLGLPSRVNGVSYMNRRMSWACSNSVCLSSSSVLSKKGVTCVTCTWASFGSRSHAAIWENKHKFQTYGYRQRQNKIKCSLFIFKQNNG